MKNIIIIIIITTAKNQNSRNWKNNFNSKANTTKRQTWKQTKQTRGFPDGEKRRHCPEYPSTRGERSTGNSVWWTSSSSSSGERKTKRTRRERKNCICNKSQRKKTRFVNGTCSPELFDLNYALWHGWNLNNKRSRGWPGMKPYLTLHLHLPLGIPPKHLLLTLVYTWPSNKINFFFFWLTLFMGFL